MSTDIVIDVGPQEVDLEWVAGLDRRFTDLGFQPQRGRTGTAVPVGVLIDDEHDSDVIPWPPDASSFIFQKGLMVHYGLFGRTDRVHGFGLTYWFDDRQNLETIWIGFSVPPFLAWYTDAWVDMTNRVMAITEVFAEVCHVESASCVSESGKVWLEYFDHGWTVVPELTLEETSEPALESMLKWVERPDVPFIVDHGSTTICYSGNSGEKPLGVLSKNPFDGARLPDRWSVADHSTGDPQLDLRFRDACWAAEPGSSQTLLDLDGYHVEIPVVEIPRCVGLVDEIDRVERLFVVEPSDSESAGLLRVMGNGRTGYILLE